ncbi:MAG TPA: DUF1192 domain-containing protein [Afifellaceae bacterium]|nr:DUF1192 domain-containing protein [Afifellaceae bacterium]
MNIFADDDKPKPSGIMIGEDLSLLSVDELQERISLCEQEIERIRAELDAKKSGLAAAEEIFRK